jgi:hypothetical protein
MSGLKSLKKNSKVDIMLEKWQERLIPSQDTEQFGQGGTSVPAEGDPAALAQAEEVARCTRELLATRGWCLWKCSILGGEVIAVVRDESVKGIPEGYPVYTEAELEQLCQDDVSDATLRLVNEAKKLTGAKVISAEEGD